MEQPEKTLLILGTRGVPANHGGFETFAERYALYPRRARLERQRLLPGGRREGHAAPCARRRLARRHAHLHPDGAAKAASARSISTWKCVRDALRRPGVCLVLGYNGAAFLPVLRIVRPQGVHQHGRHRVEAAEMVAARARLVLSSTNGSPPGPRSGSSPITRRSPTIWRRAVRARRRWSFPMAAIPCSSARRRRRSTSSGWSRAAI